MFVGAFLTFMAIGGFPSFVEDMKVCNYSRVSLVQRQILSKLMHLMWHSYIGQR